MEYFSLPQVHHYSSCPSCTERCSFQASYCTREQTADQSYGNYHATVNLTFPVNAMLYECKLPSHSIVWLLFLIIPLHWFCYFHSFLHYIIMHNTCTSIKIHVLHNCGSDYSCLCHYSCNLPYSTLYFGFFVLSFSPVKRLTVVCVWLNFNDTGTHSPFKSNQFIFTCIGKT